jgi:competence protein ComEC
MPRAGWLATGALIAALLPTTVGVGAQTLAVLGLALLCAAGASRLVRRTRLSLALVGAALVALRIGIPAVLAGEVPFVPLAATLDGTWSAEVVGLGSTAGGTQRSHLLVQARTGEPLRVYATLPRYPIVVAGDRISFDGSLEPPPRDESGFAEYLTRSGFHATTRPRAFAVEASPADALGVVQGIRRAADEALARALPEPEAGLASGIVVGRRDRVSRSVADDFTTTGLSHVVAISGWNIALVGSVVGSLLLAAGMPRRHRTMAILIAIGLYAVLAGGSASVVRAAVMGGVALAAREAGRPGTAAAALGLAIVGLLLLDPQMAADVGFQLSAVATAGLLAWGQPLTDRLESRLGGRAGRWLAGSLGVSLAAQAATLPLVLFHFGRLSLISPLANLVIAPLVAPAMLFGVLALLAGLLMLVGLPAFVVAPLTLAGWAVLGSMVGVADALAAVPLASVTLPEPWDVLLATGAACALLAVALRGGRAAQRTAQVAVRPAAPARVASDQRPRRTAVVAAIACVTCVALGFGALLVSRGPARLVLTVLDVGQGDAMLLEGPRGTRILIDSGPDPDRLIEALDGTVAPWDRRIDLAVVSHPHEDHVAGMALLLDRYRVGSIAENGMLGAGPGDGAFRRALTERRIGTVRLAAGDRLDLDGAAITVLWPRRGSVPHRSPSSGKAINNTSIVFDVRFGQRRMILTGDVEEEIDPELIATGIAATWPAPLDVLKVAHHGSGTATTDAFLDALDPRVTLVSAGLGNPYGHPSPRTIGRLEAHGARVLRTDHDGSLQVATDGSDLHVATTGGRPPGSASTRGPTEGIRPGARLASNPATTSVLCAVPLRFPSVSAERDGSRVGAGGIRVAKGALVAPVHPANEAPLSDDCYDRPCDGPLPQRSGDVAARPVPVSTAAAAFGRGRGNRRISRAARGPPWREGRPPRGGVGRPASRFGQGIAEGACAAVTRSRTRWCPMVGRPRPGGARSRSREPSRGPPHRAGL